MLDFHRRFTVRIGRRPVRNGDATKRTSVVSKRASVRNSTALRRAPSGAGGLHRGASVRCSQSALRRGASVKRAPSAARRNSKRISTLVVDRDQPSSPVPPSPAPESPIPAADPVPSAAVAPPATSKSFFTKLTSRFRGRSKLPKSDPEGPSLSIPTLQTAPVGILSTSNLSPVSPAPRSPSLRSPSPASRVTFVDAPVETSKAPSVTAEPSANDTLHPDSAASINSATKPAQPSAVVDNDDDDDWVDTEEDDSEPHKSLDAKPSAALDSIHAGSPAQVPTSSGEYAGVVVPDLLATDTHQHSGDQSEVDVQVASLRMSLLGALSLNDFAADARVTQWLATSTASGGPEDLVDGEQQKNLQDGEPSTGTSTPSKRESKRPRLPQIIVPPLASNNPYRLPLPPSPSPSALSDNQPFCLAQPGLAVETPNTEAFIPPSPSILLTPAAHFDDVDGLEFTLKRSGTLAVDCTHVPLPASPSPSSVSLPECDELQTASPLSDQSTVARANSVSTQGGRSLSTAPSTLGPATPTSMRFPGHPALAHFSFGGPSSPKVDGSEEDEDERRGRSLEVADNKRRMRSVSPKLDAVLEGDESRRSSRVSFEGVDPSSGESPSPLPVVEVVTFGKKAEDDSESEHEDECGFYAFAEKKLEQDKKTAEARQLSVPKRSKTMTFLNGFGKRKNTAGDVPPSIPRSSTSSRLLALPPKQSSTLLAPNRSSRLMPGQRSSTMLADPCTREALSPIMYTAGDIQAETSKIEDEESRRLSEAVFMF